MLVDTECLFNARGDELANDQDWCFHISLSRPSWIAQDECAAQLLDYLRSRWEGSIVHFPILYVSESGVAYLDYSLNKRTEILDDLWELHSRGPFKTRYMHISM